jgi:uncharacterized protein YbjT (DUF2867 family)
MIAIVIGATGLVGRHLLKQLLADERFRQVKVFHRRKTGETHPRLKEYVIDFDDIASWQEQLKGDVLFSTLGTTLKTAGSKEAQYRVDYTYQYEVARATAEQGVNNYVLVSSAGADSSSMVFYSRMKGELDAAVQQLPFQRVLILRPSMLDGDRQEERLGEKIGLAVGRLLPYLPFAKKYRPIHAEIVARAMIKGALQPDGKSREIAELEEVFQLAEK